MMQDLCGAIYEIAPTTTTWYNFKPPRASSDSRILKGGRNPVDGNCGSVTCCLVEALRVIRTLAARAHPGTTISDQERAKEWHTVRADQNISGSRGANLNLLVD